MSPVSREANGAMNQLERGVTGTQKPINTMYVLIR